MKLGIPVITFLFASLAAAAGIDGKWVSEWKNKSKGGAEQAVTMTLELKSSGSALTGTASAGGRRGRGMEIRDGKVDGNKFSFTTVQTTKKGENKVQWEGTVEGDAMKGTRTRDGAKRGQPFEAKRAQ